MTILAKSASRFAAENSADLLKASVRLSFRPPDNSTPDTFVVNFRSQVMCQLSPYIDAFPTATNLFLYREPVSWANSVFAMAQRLAGITDLLTPEQTRFMWEIHSNDADTRFLEIYCDTSQQQVPAAEVLTASWALIMGQYLDAQKLGMKFETISYDQLNTRRDETIRRLLTTCGLGLTHLDWAMTAYDQDSQHGTVASGGSKGKALNEIQTRNMQTALRDHPFYQSVG